jgi:hypothetical protein
VIVVRHSGVSWHSAGVGGLVFRVERISYDFFGVLTFGFGYGFLNRDFCLSSTLLPFRSCV